MVPCTAKRCSKWSRRSSSTTYSYAGRRLLALYTMLGLTNGGRMPVSATLAMIEEVARRRRLGIPTVPLGFGEAGLPVHAMLTAELNTWAQDAAYGPSAGIAALREAAAGYWTRRGLPTEPDHVVAGPGSKPLLWATLGSRPGAVAVPKPCWVSYAAQAAMHGRTVRAT